MNIKRILSLSLLLCSGFALGMEPAGTATRELSSEVQAKMNNDLASALIFDNKSNVAKLIADKTYVNAKLSYGWTVLMRMARLGCADLVKILLENDADVNAKDNVGQTALHIAAHYGFAWCPDHDRFKAVVSLLLNHTINPGMPTKEQLQQLYKDKTYFSLLSQDIFKHSISQKYGKYYPIATKGAQEIANKVKAENPQMANFMLNELAMDMHRESIADEMQSGKFSRRDLIRKLHGPECFELKKEHQAILSKKFSRYDLIKKSAGEFEKLPIFDLKK